MHNKTFGAAVVLARLHRSGFVLVLHNPHTISFSRNADSNMGRSERLYIRETGFLGYGALGYGALATLAHCSMR